MNRNLEIKIIHQRDNQNYKTQDSVSNPNSMFHTKECIVTNFTEECITLHTALTMFINDDK